MKTSLLPAAPVVGALALLLAGCRVGPDYHPPAPAVGGHWHAAPPAPTAPADAGDLARWWTRFGDPQLDSLIARAFQANLDLALARERLRAARAQTDIARGALLPTLDASGAYTRERLPRNGFPPLPPYVVSPESDLFNTGLDASWEIDIFGGARRGVEAASAQWSAQAYNAEAVRLSVAAEVARDYFQLRAAQARLGLAREAVEIQQASLDLTTQRVTQGVATDLSREQAAALVATTAATLPPLDTSLQADTFRLAVLLGQSPGELGTELTNATALPLVLPLVPAGLPSALLSRRPDLRAAERQVAAASAQIGVAKADLLPKFYLTGMGNFTSVSADTWFAPNSRAWSIGPSVQWRIFDAGRVRANIRLQKSLGTQAELQYQQAVLNALEEVENALTSYAREQEGRQSLAAAAAATARAVTLATQLSDQGLGTYFAVLDARRALNQARDQVAQSDQALAVDLVALCKALGGGWDPPGERPGVAANARP